MKVQLRTALKCQEGQDFECFDDQQIIFPSGNTLCIKEVSRNDAEFISINKHLRQLLAFKPATNKKGVFTAERTDSGVEVALYTLSSQRRSMLLSQESQFFIEVQSMQLFVDDYDSNIVYGSARNSQGSCVFLCDLIKNKLLALGFLPFFEDLKVDNRQNMTLSVCGHNGSFTYIKYLRYGLSQWEIQEYPYKKMNNQTYGTVITHEILAGGRMLFATKTAFYIFQDQHLLQTLPIQNGKQIISIHKVPKGLLIQMEDHTIELYVQEADEVTFVRKGVLPIQLQEEDSIHAVRVSHSNEEVYVRTRLNHLYRWKSENIHLDLGHSEMRFRRVETSCNYGQASGNISISTGKRFCLLTGSKMATIWSLQTNELVLSSEFSTDSHKKCILSSSINPDGNSFLVSFEDRIRIYKILLTKFKFYAEFFIKKCTQIVYSHGGQLVACKYGKGVNTCIRIINLMRLVEVSTIKVQAEPLQIVWNQLDDEIIVSAQNRTVQVFRVSDNIRTCNVKFDSPILHVRLDYRVRKMLVSTQGKIWVVDGGEIIDQIVPTITAFQYVFPLYGMYFMVGKNGVLYWSSSLRFQNCNKMTLFRQQPFQLVCRNGLIVAYTNYQNVMVVECQREGGQKRASDRDVVMVQRQEITTLFDKVRFIDSNFEVLQSAMQVSLDDERINYQAAIQKFKQNFSKEIQFINRQLSELTGTKLRQEKESQKTFSQLQSGQVRSVNDLENMYTLKFKLERERLMKMQQRALEDKKRYENIIFELQAKYHRQVVQIREQYMRRNREDMQRADQIKNHHLKDKQRLQFKLLDLEEENELAVADIQLEKDQLIASLREKVMHLEEEYDTLLIRLHNHEQKLVAAQEQRQEWEIGQQRLNQLLKEANNRVKLLQSEAQNKKTMIEQKNQVIRQQAHQIEALEKAKFVLSMRTTEIRKEIQPKQTIIDKLKSELFKLDEEYKQQKRTLFSLNQQLEKHQKIGELLKKQNFEMAGKLRQKQRNHDQLCSQIFMVINTIDPKQWNSSFVKIYQAYIKEHNKFKTNGKSKEDTAQQINRHLVHVQQSLQQITNGKDKNLKRKQDQLTKKMDQNSTLLYELNLMRKNQKMIEREKKEMGIALQKLKRELNQTYKSSNAISTRAHTTATKRATPSTATNRATASRDALTREKSLLIDMNEYAQSGVACEVKSRSSRVRSRISSRSKTPGLRHENMEQGNRFFEIAKELQTCRNTIKVQDQVIQELNQRLFVGEGDK